MNNQLNKGFTLVEVLIAIFIFSILFLIVGDVFIATLRMQRSAFEIQQIEENANIVLESLTKEIRVATIDPSAESMNCPAVPDTVLRITNDSGVLVEYMVDNEGRVLRKIGGSSVFSPLSANTVQFTKFGFCVTGVGVGDAKQPRVTILGTIKRGNSTVNIQSTVSLRKIDS